MGLGAIVFWVVMCVFLGPVSCVHLSDEERQALYKSKKNYLSEQQARALNPETGKYEYTRGLDSNEHVDIAVVGNNGITIGCHGPYTNPTTFYSDVNGGYTIVHDLDTPIDMKQSNGQVIQIVIHDVLPQCRARLFEEDIQPRESIVESIKIIAPIKENVRTTTPSGPVTGTVTVTKSTTIKSRPTFPATIKRFKTTPSIFPDHPDRPEISRITDKEVSTSEIIEIVSENPDVITISEIPDVTTKPTVPRVTAEVTTVPYERKTPAPTKPRVPKVTPNPHPTPYDLRSSPWPSFEDLSLKEVFEVFEKPFEKTTLPPPHIKKTHHQNLTSAPSVSISRIYLPPPSTNTSTISVNEKNVIEGKPTNIVTSILPPVQQPTARITSTTKSPKVHWIIEPPWTTSTPKPRGPQATRPSLPRAPSTPSIPYPHSKPTPMTPPPPSTPSQCVPDVVLFTKQIEEEYSDPFPLSFEHCTCTCPNVKRVPTVILQGINRG